MMTAKDNPAETDESLNGAEGRKTKLSPGTQSFSDIRTRALE